MFCFTESLRFTQSVDDDLRQGASVLEMVSEVVPCYAAIPLPTSCTHVIVSLIRLSYFFINLEVYFHLPNSTFLSPSTNPFHSLSSPVSQHTLISLLPQKSIPSTNLCPLFPPLLPPTIRASTTTSTHSPHTSLSTTGNLKCSKALIMIPTSIEDLVGGLLVYGKKDGKCKRRVERDMREQRRGGRVCSEGVQRVR